MVHKQTTVENFSLSDKRNAVLEVIKKFIFLLRKPSSRNVTRCNHLNRQDLLFVRTVRELSKCINNSFQLEWPASVTLTWQQ